MTQNQAQMIYIIRGTTVMLDRDLAELYKVETRILNQAVKRNIGRFPLSFMFQLTKEELENLRSQFVITNSNNLSISAKSRSLPNAFSEHGVLMVAAILNSKVAIDVSVKLIEEFNRMRRASLTQEEVLTRLDQHDKQFRVVFDAINRIYEIEQAQEQKKFGFIAKLDA